MTKPDCAGGRDRWVALAFTLWAGTVSVAFLAANGGYLLAKLAERGLLP